MGEQELLGIGVGSLLADRYEIDEVLGRGGSGAVFGVRDLALGRERVALKLLSSELVTDSTDVERFRQEVLISRRLTHPNIVRTYEFGQLKSGQSYVVMEFVRGKSLEQILDQQQQGLGIDLIVRILVEVAKGMAYAHENGVVHRDLKPGNVLLESDGTVKIADFGLARSSDFESKLTQSGECVGTPMYMAPEQVTGKLADHRVDIYGLGIIAYELCTGSAPYNAAVWYTLASQIVSQPLPKLSQSRPKVPLWFEAFVNKATAKSPGDRYQTMEEVIAVLTPRLGEKEAPAKATVLLPIAQRHLMNLLQHHATMYVLLGCTLAVALVTTGFSKTASPELAIQVNQGTDALGKFVNTLTKLNDVIGTTYRNSDAIDRFLNEETKRRAAQQNPSGQSATPAETASAEVSAAPSPTASPQPSPDAPAAPAPQPTR